MDLRALTLVEGRWLNNGNDASDTLEHARQRIAQMRASTGLNGMRDERPPIADPPAHLKLFVDFLKQEAKDPQEFVLDAVEKHRMVILGEIHHRPRYWAFASAVVRFAGIRSASRRHLHGASLQRPAACRSVPCCRQVQSEASHRNAARQFMDGLAGPADA